MTSSKTLQLIEIKSHVVGTISQNNFDFLWGNDSLYFGCNKGTCLSAINIHKWTWRILPAFQDEHRGAYPNFEAFLHHPEFDLLA